LNIDFPTVKKQLISNESLKGYKKEFLEQILIKTVATNNENIIAKY